MNASKLQKALLEFSYFLRVKFGVNLGKYLFKSIRNQVFGTEIEAVGGGGAKFSASNVKFLFSLGLEWVDVYASTETGVPCASTCVGDRMVVGTEGNVYAIPEIQIAIGEKDINGHGEILVNSKMMMKGYFRQPELTKESFANDGIASPIAVLKGDDGRPRSLMCSMASMLLIDTEVLASAPIQLIKAGIGDILSNYMALLDWKLASKRGKEQLNGYAYLMSKNAYNLLLNSKHSKICKEFVDELVNAHILSGLAMNFTQSSRAVSGSEHLFSHALDYYSNVKNLHGIQTALGTIAVLKLIGKEYEAVLDCLRRYQVDINPKKLGIDEDSFTYCMQHAVEIRPDRYTHLHEVDLSDKCVKELYRKLVKEL